MKPTKLLMRPAFCLVMGISAFAFAASSHAQVSAHTVPVIANSKDATPEPEKLVDKPIEKTAEKPEKTEKTEKTEEKKPTITALVPKVVSPADLKAQGIKLVVNKGVVTFEGYVNQTCAAHLLELLPSVSFAASTDIDKFKKGDDASNFEALTGLQLRLNTEKGVIDSFADCAPAKKPNESKISLSALNLRYAFPSGNKPMIACLADDSNVLDADIVGNKAHALLMQANCTGTCDPLSLEEASAIDTPLMAILAQGSVDNEIAAANKSQKSAASLDDLAAIRDRLILASDRIAKNNKIPSKAKQSIIDKLHKAADRATSQQAVYDVFFQSNLSPSADEEDAPSFYSARRRGSSRKVDPSRKADEAARFLSESYDLKGAMAGISNIAAENDALGAKAFSKGQPEYLMLMSDLAPESKVVDKAIASYLKKSIELDGAVSQCLQANPRNTSACEKLSAKAQAYKQDMDFMPQIAVKFNDLNPKYERYLNPQGSSQASAQQMVFAGNNNNLNGNLNNSRSADPFKLNQNVFNNPCYVNCGQNGQYAGFDATQLYQQRFVGNQPSYAQSFNGQNSVAGAGNFAREIPGISNQQPGYQGFNNQQGNGGNNGGWYNSNQGNSNNSLYQNGNGNQIPYTPFTVQNS